MNWRTATVLLLLTWYIFFLAWPINLIRADLGRHIKNGEILLSSPFHSWRPLLTTNFYSYTFPDSPFINHHWGSGVVFYLVHHASGFNGLSIFFIAVNIVTLTFFWLSARRYVSFAQAAFLSFLLIPFMAERYEIRPEIFSFLFIGIYWYILDGYRTSMIRDKMLWLLPLFQALWINLHIYFFFGFVLLAAFVIGELADGNRHRAKRLTGATLAAVVASLLNPSGVAGLFYPLRIFGNYDLALEENTPLISYLRLAPGYVNGWICLLVALTVMVLTLLALMKNRRSIPVSYWLIGSFIFLLVFKSVRNISFLAFFGFIFIAFLVHSLRPASPPPQENQHQTYEPMAGGRHCCFQLSHTLS